MTEEQKIVEMKPQPVVGRVVRFPSGSQEMTVAEIDDEKGEAAVMWHDVRGTFQMAAVPVSTLVLVDKSENAVDPAQRVFVNEFRLRIKELSEQVQTLTLAHQGELDRRVTLQERVENVTRTINKTLLPGEIGGTLEDAAKLLLQRHERQRREANDQLTELNNKLASALSRRNPS